MPGESVPPHARFLLNAAFARPSTICCRRARARKKWKRARVWLVHDPPRFVVPGAPLTLAVMLDARGGGELCEPWAILAPKSRRKYRRYRMRERDADRWEATIDIPYDDQWAQGVRYFMECCWEEDCPVRWRGPGAPYNLDAPDF